MRFGEAPHVCVSDNPGLSVATDALYLGRSTFALINPRDSWARMAINPRYNNSQETLGIDFHHIYMDDVDGCVSSPTLPFDVLEAVIAGGVERVVPSLVLTPNHAYAADNIAHFVLESFQHALSGLHGAGLVRSHGGVGPPVAFIRSFPDPLKHVGWTASAARHNLEHVINDADGLRYSEANFASGKLMDRINVTQRGYSGNALRLPSDSGRGLYGRATTSRVPVGDTDVMPGVVTAMMHYAPPNIRNMLDMTVSLSSYFDTTMPFGDVDPFAKRAANESVGTAPSDPAAGSDVWPSCGPSCTWRPVPLTIRDGHPIITSPNMGSEGFAGTSRLWPFNPGCAAVPRVGVEPPVMARVVAMARRVETVRGAPPQAAARPNFTTDANPITWRVCPYAGPPLAMSEGGLSRWPFIWTSHHIPVRHGQRDAAGAVASCPPAFVRGVDRNGTELEPWYVDGCKGGGAASVAIPDPLPQGYRNPIPPYPQPPGTKPRNTLLPYDLDDLLPLTLVRHLVLPITYWYKKMNQYRHYLCSAPTNLLYERDAYLPTKPFPTHRSASAAAAPHAVVTTSLPVPPTGADAPPTPPPVPHPDTDGTRSPTAVRVAAVFASIVRQQARALRHSEGSVGVDREGIRGAAAAGADSNSTAAAADPDDHADDHVDHAASAAALAAWRAAYTADAGDGGDAGDDRAPWATAAAVLASPDGRPILERGGSLGIAMRAAGMVSADDVAMLRAAVAEAASGGAGAGRGPRRPRSGGGRALVGDTAGGSDDDDDDGAGSWREEAVLRGLRRRPSAARAEEDDGSAGVRGARAAGAATAKLPRQSAIHYKSDFRPYYVPLEYHAVALAGSIDAMFQTSFRRIPPRPHPAPYLLFPEGFGPYGPAAAGGVPGVDNDTVAGGEPRGAAADPPRAVGVPAAAPARSVPSFAGPVDPPPSYAAPASRVRPLWRVRLPRGCAKSPYDPNATWFVVPRRPPKDAPVCWNSRGLTGERELRTAVEVAGSKGLLPRMGWEDLGFLPLRDAADATDKIDVLFSILGAFDGNLLYLSRGATRALPFGPWDFKQYIGVERLYQLQTVRRFHYMITRIPSCHSDSYLCNISIPSRHLVGALRALSEGIVRTDHSFKVAPGGYVSYDQATCPQAATGTLLRHFPALHPVAVNRSSIFDFMRWQVKEHSTIFLSPGDYKGSERRVEFPHEIPPLKCPQVLGNYTLEQPTLWPTDGEVPIIDVQL